MRERAVAKRSYGQYCPVAAGLDLIGDRWVLLICRELVGGPRGFNELKRALPGLASNLLSTRMRTMVADGLVARDEGGYRLTQEGRAVIPVLRAIARFGVRGLSSEPTEPVNAYRSTRAFLLPWAMSDKLPPLVIVHAADGSRADLVVENGVAGVREHADSSSSDVVHLHVDAGNLASVRRGESTFTGHVEGPGAAAAAVLAALLLTPPEA
ncbi:winged helix-turn-helix transcriptional regulator [Cumulibacter soli]|uniref:winged helix-turn-helix transcriptional regulator n=1 Tax=Cumulibacter soli TaxID=2546344 RepID=UPI001068C97D|nr:helix-turn-helix domain-containing protein [Cumulibacter soli]